MKSKEITGRFVCLNSNTSIYSKQSKLLTLFRIYRSHNDD
nr:MAG TPA: hypothetical protein [Caudoviricetes sp.]